MVDFQYKDSYDVRDLEEIVRILRAPGGCPWDAEQTHESIRRNFLEEAYEAVEAIDEQSPDHLKEELGDLLFSAVNVSRFLKVDPEVALGKATDKFIDRFRKVEAQAAAQNQSMEGMALEELDKLWEHAKET